jgi:hypothetical protein
MTHDRQGRPGPGRFMLIGALCLAAVGFAPAGCDGDREAGSDPDLLARGLDTTAPPAEVTGPRDTTSPPAEVAPDVPPVDPCVALPFDGIVPVDLWGPDTQINGAAAFDGGGIWVTYNRRDVDGGSGFDVFATRIGCDGAVLVEPFLVNEAVAFNETDPAVAVSGDTVMFAWQSESGVAPINLSVWYRSYFTDGTPRMAQDRILDFDPGDPAAGPRAWMPALAGTDEGFALAAAAAPEGYSGFQTWLQDLDRDGDATAPGLYLLPDPDHSQVWPSLGASAGGALRIAWERQHVEDPSVLQTVTRDADGVSAAVVLADAVGGPSLSRDTGAAVTWIATGYAAAAGQSVALFAAETTGEGPELHVLENDGALDHTPVLASGAAINAVAWCRNLGGLKNDLLVRAFVTDGTAPAWVGAPRTVNPVPAGPYPSALVALPGGFFAVWSDGDGPDYRLKGRFITLEEARR